MHALGFVKRTFGLGLPGQIRLLETVSPWSAMHGLLNLQKPPQPGPVWRKGASAVIGSLIR